MRISSNTISEGIVRQIQLLGNQQAKLQTQVSTGQRLSQPEDNPAAAGRVLDRQSELRRVDRYMDNADRALEVSQASYSGLTEVKKISDRVTELGTLAQGATNQESLNAYGAEVNQLIEQLVQLGNTRLGNDYIYAGTAVDTPPFTAVRDAQGQITSVSYDGNNSQATIALSDNSGVSPFTSGATNSSLADMMNQLVALRDAFAANDRAAITTTQSALLSNEDTLVSSLAEHGAIQMRIDVARAQQQTLADNITAMVNFDTSADLPETIVKLNQTQTAYQAALQSAANIMRLSLLDYIQ